VVVGVAGGGDEEGEGNSNAPVASADQTTTVPAEPSTTEERPTTTRAPTTTAAPTTTTTPPPPQAVSATGRGDDVIPISRVDGADQAVLVYARHSGTSNFSLEDGNDLLVNEIGAYEGVTFSAAGDQLQITADGPWTIEFRSIRAAQPYSDPSLAGRGDNVILYTGPSGIAAFTHNGESNFAVVQAGEAGTDLLVNEIGAYTGRVPAEAGPSVFIVTADGDWSITITQN
jgi:hypothetical protein